MAKNSHIFQYEIDCIPDPGCTKYKTIASGNIKEPIASGCEHLLRTLSHMQSAKAWAKIIFVYKPAESKPEAQTRLKPILEIGSDDEESLCGLRKLIEGGLLSRFYEFNSSQTVLPDSDKLNCRCSVIRRQEFVKPLYNCEFNHKIPEFYYTITPFEADTKNDYLTLDKVLDHVDEQVIVSIKVVPADISKQLHAHTAYLARLNSINRSWDDDYEDIINHTGFDEGYKTSSSSLKPLTYKDPLADDILRRQRRLHESLGLPHLNFEIEVLAQTRQTAELIGSVVAESAFKKGSYRLVLDDSGEQTDNIPQMYRHLTSLTNLATVDELAGLFCFPVGSAASSPLCIRKNTDPDYIEPESLIVLGHDQNHIPRGIVYSIMKKHCAFFGLSGSGKTTGNINLSMQVTQRNTPLLVIESAKTEYRILKKFKKHKNPAIRKLAKKLRVFTAGSQISPLNINPFRVPRGITVNEHIETLLECFKSAIPVSCGSLPALIGEALERIYQRFDTADKPPVMSDLITAVKEVLDSKGYSAETRSDMQTVIEVRLGVLARRLIGEIFGCRHGIDIAELMANPTVIELDRLCPEQKCLLTLFILTQIQEFLKTSPGYEGPLRFVILIEEAHNIFGSAGNSVASEEVADPKSQLTELLFKMLVELRALGVAIILSDQHPSALDPAAIKTPVSKVAFCQVHNDDRRQIASSILLNSHQEQDLARLRPGEAFLFTEGYHYPLRIKTVNLHKQMDLSQPLTDEQLHEIVSKESWFTRCENKRIEDQLGQFKDALDSFDNFRRSLNQDVQNLIELREKIRKLKDNPVRNQHLTTIIAELFKKKRLLSTVQKQLASDIENRFGNFRSFEKIKDEKLRHFSQVLFGRFDNSVKPSVDKLLLFITDQIRKCNQLKIKEKTDGQK